MSRQGMFPLYAAAAAMTACESLVFAYLPIALYWRTGEQALPAIALITAAPAVVRFFAAQGWGVAIDRTRRQKPFIVAGLAAHAVLLALLAAAEDVGRAVLLVSAGAAVYSAVSPAARTAATLADERASGGRAPLRILPGLLKAESVGWLIGGMLPGYLLDHTALEMPSLLRGAGVLASLTALAAIIWLRDAAMDPARPGHAKEGAAAPDPAPAPAPPRLEQPAAAAKDGLLTLYRRPEFAGLLLALFFIFFAREAFFTVYGIYLTELGGSTTLYGASISIATLLGIGLYDAAARLVRRWGDVRLVRVTGAVYVLGYGVTVLWPNPWVLAAYFSLPLFPFLTMASAAAAAARSEARERGRSLGILEAVDLLAVALGSTSAGSAAARWGLASVPVLALSVGSAGLLLSSRLRRWTGARRNAALTRGAPDGGAQAQAGHWQGMSKNS
ncbi:MAG: MFS transporter [Limnochordia bacterium]